MVIGPTATLHPTVQTRCLNLARLGYVTFSSTQNHFEDPSVGVSHQTLMVWNNMRALDFLESLPEVDASRIGVAGESGGGLQTQMLVALDPRVKAATIVGLTCDFRQIMFPDSSHCACNHFPNVMQRTDHPEISTLGLPCPVQYLTMNDWTRQFAVAEFSDDPAALCGTRNRRSRRLPLLRHRSRLRQAEAGIHLLVARPLAVRLDQCRAGRRTGDSHTAGRCGGTTGCRSAERQGFWRNLASCA